MANILDLYCRAIKFTIALCLAVMVVLVFVNVVLRYFFNSGITVSEQLSRWLMAWLTFLGAILALCELSPLCFAPLLRPPQQGSHRRGEAHRQEEQKDEQPQVHSAEPGLKERPVHESALPGRCAAVREALHPGAPFLTHGGVDSAPVNPPRLRWPRAHGRRPASV